MGKTDFFHRGQNYLIYTSKYLQNIGVFAEKILGTNFWYKIFNLLSLELRNVRVSVINGSTEIFAIQGHPSELVKSMTIL